MALPYDDDDITALLARDQALRDAVLGRLRQSQTPAGATPDVADRQMGGAWVNGQWVPLPSGQDAPPVDSATMATTPQYPDPSMIETAGKLGQLGGLGADPGAPAERPPVMYSAPSAATTLFSAPQAAMSGAFGSMLDQTQGAIERGGAGRIDPVQVGRGALDAVKGGLSQGTFQPISEQEFPTLQSSLRERDVSVSPMQGLSLDVLGDPMNLVGDPVSDLGKLGMAGIIGGPKLAGKAVNLFKGLSKAEIAAKIAEKFPTGTNMMRKRYPNLAKRIAQYGRDLALEGVSRSPAKAVDALAQEIYQQTLSLPGTTTYPLTGEQEVAGVSKGVLAGRISNQTGKLTGQTVAIPLNQFTPDSVKQFIDANAESFAKNPKLAIGTWKTKDPKTGQDLVYLDISAKYGTERNAITQAAAQRQPKDLQRTVRQPFPMVIDGRRVMPPPIEEPWEMPQKAVFNLQTFKETPVGNLREFLNSEEFQMRLAEQLKVGQKVMNGKDWWNLYGGPLEEIYGKELVKPLAGFLASTSPASAPVHNMRAASEYLRRLIKGEPIIQPDFRIPNTAVGSRPGMMGAQGTGDFNAPGTQMPMEKTRQPNLERVERGEYDQLRDDRSGQLGQDKINDMFHALTGEDIGVYDRRYAKIAEDYDRGIYVSPTKDKVPGSMKSGKVGPYALIENAVREGAKRAGMPLKKFSAYVWEGIGETIKTTGQLYGMKHPAHTIPSASEGFNNIINDMVNEKAKAWGITAEEFKKRLRNGDAELLMAVLATPAGISAYQQWEDRRQSSAPPASPNGRKVP